jgi:hypothetical protein
MVLVEVYVCVRIADSEHQSGAACARSASTRPPSNKPLQQTKPRDILSALKHACGFAAERQGR